MGVRSIIDIEVNDQAFKDFKAAFDTYTGEVRKIPSAWVDANKEINNGGKQIDKINGKLVDQQVEIDKINKTGRDTTRGLREQETVWRSMSRTTSSVAGNIASATGQLMKWTGLTAVFSGLLGAGGLFGISRLAGNVADTRRSSQGLGVSYGQQKAFGLNFDRLVDSSSFLGAINDAKTDVTKRPGLMGAGFSTGQIDSKNSAQLGSEMLSYLKRIVDRVPEGQLAQELQARRLDQFISTQDAQRLRNTSPAELAKLQADYRKDQDGLGLGTREQSTWQNFSTQLDRAGKNIENVFVRGLEPLIGPLGDLSNSVTEAVKTFLSAPKLKDWIRDLGTGLEKAAVYLGSDDFQNKVKQFVESFGDVVDTVVKVAGWLPGRQTGGDFTRALTGGAPTGSSGASNPWGANTTPTANADTGVKRNNPGNIRPPGSATGFQTYATEADGYKAMAKQLKLYQDRDKIDTISGVISKWAPPSENDTRAYIDNVAKRTGMGANDKLDLNNPDQMSKLIAAMARQENHRNTVSPDAVKVQIYGAPGGNVITSAQQVVTP